MEQKDKKITRESIKNIPFLGNALVFFNRKLRLPIIRFYKSMFFKSLSMRYLLLIHGKVLIWDLLKLYKVFVSGYQTADIDYNGKTVFFIFGGRKDRMFLLMKYVEVLLNQKQIDYVHIWNFTKNKNDYEYLKSLEDKSKNIFVFSLKNFVKLSDKTSWENYLYYAALIYYKTVSQFQNTNFVKCDDDIIYMDTKRFSHFLNKVKKIDPDSEYYMVSANVVNNGFCTYFSQKHNLIPETVGFFEHPNPEYETNEYWDHGKLSQKLHEYFIQNKEQFILNAKNLPDQLVDIGNRLSINFIGFKQSAIPKFQKYTRGDEYTMTVLLSKLLNKKIMIDMSFVVSHLSFRGQKEQDDQEMLVKYGKLLEQ